MTRSVNYRRPRLGSSKGFTLVEMLVVAALLSLFAGLAVFNIQAAYEQNKQKAAVAECRQIATAVSFCYQDMSIFPKLCFLQFNTSNLLDQLTPNSTTFVNGLEYHSYVVGNLPNRIQKDWKGIYSALNAQKLVKMQYDAATETLGNPTGPTGTITRTVDWPADPWSRPYVMYLIKTIPGQPSRESFFQSSADRADNFAGVVSYGRNGVPGLGDTPDPTDAAARLGLRLYDQLDPLTFRLLRPSEYTDPRLEMIKMRPTPDFARPYIRETGSDDRFAEF